MPWPSFSIILLKSVFIKIVYVDVLNAMFSDEFTVCGNIVFEIEFDWMFDDN